MLDQHFARYAPTGQIEAHMAYAELLSIAEFLAESSDATRLREAFAKADPTRSVPDDQDE